ncbi:MAG: MFS transporter [Clostridia bacterium]
MEPAPSATAAARHHRTIMTTVLLAIFLTAMDGTVVTTAMPAIIRSLHGLSLYSWVFTVYMLTTAITMPVWGKLADIYGPRSLFLLGVSVFLAGSMLSGSSTSMAALSAFRALQGVGAGAMSALGYTVIGVTLPPDERARASGFVGAMWGIASIVGPLLGGLLVFTVGWRGVFYVNLPLGLVALWLGARVIPPGAVQSQSPQIDWAGGLLVAAGVGLGLITLQLAQAGSAWYLWCGLLAILLLVGFVWVERRVKEPMLAPFLFQERLFAVANAVSFLSAFAVFAVLDYLPLLVPPGMPRGFGAAAIVFPSTLTWSLSSFIVSRYVVRVGTRTVAIAGMAVVVVGMGVFLTATGPHSPLWLVALLSAPIGAGIGPLTPALLSAMQNRLPLTQIGMGSATQQLVQQVGGTLGVSVLQLAFARAMLKSGGTAVGAALISGGTNISPGVFTDVVRAFHQGLTPVLGVAVLGAALAWALPRGRLPGS